MLFNSLQLSGVCTIFTAIVQHLSKIQQVSPICNTVDNLRSFLKKKDTSMSAQNHSTSPASNTTHRLQMRCQLISCVHCLNHAAAKQDSLFSFSLQYFIHSFQAGCYLKRQFWGFSCDFLSHSSLTGDWDVMLVKGTPYGEIRLPHINIYVPEQGRGSDGQPQAQTHSAHRCSRYFTSDMWVHLPVS